MKKIMLLTIISLMFISCKSVIGVGDSEDAKIEIKIDRLSSIKEGSSSRATWKLKDLDITDSCVVLTYLSYKDDYWEASPSYIKLGEIEFDKDFTYNFERNHRYSPLRYKVVVMYPNN